MATPTTLPASFTSGQVLTAAQMNNLRGAFRVLQVVSTTKTDTFVATVGQTWTNITGLSATITPSSTSSKILIVGNVNGGGGTVTKAGWAIRLTGGNAASYVGDTAGSRTRTATSGLLNNAAAEKQNSLPIFYLDTPSTTSAITYQVQGVCFGTNDVLAVNRAVSSGDDTDSSVNARSASTITVLEISA